MPSSARRSTVSPLPAFAWRGALLAAVCGLIPGCGNGNGESTVIEQKVEKDIDATLKFQVEVSGKAKRVFELFIPAGTLEESATITVVQSEEPFAGRTLTRSYRLEPAATKFVAEKKAVLTMGYVEEGSEKVSAEVGKLGIQEEGLRIGRLSKEGDWVVLSSSGAPRRDLDELSGEIAAFGEFAVVYNPIIVSVSPQAGLAAQTATDGTVTEKGTEITIIGYNFATGDTTKAGAQQVMFGKVPVSEITTVAEGTLVLNLPALAKGQTEEDLRGDMSVTIKSDTGPSRKSNTVRWGFGSGFDAAVYDHSLSWGKLSTLQANATDCADEKTKANVACFNLPWGIAVDTFGCVYVTDTWNHRVLKFTGDGIAARTKTCDPFVSGDSTRFITGGKGTATTTAGSPPPDAGKEPTLIAPLGIAVDLQGKIYVADSGNHRVVVLDNTGVVLPITIGGTRGSGDGQLDGPSGVALDPSGNLYVVDTANDRVVLFDPSTGAVVRTLGPTITASGVDLGRFSFLGMPTALAFDATAKRLYVADPGNFRIVYFERDDAGTDVPVKAVGQAATGTKGGKDVFFRPIGVAVDLKSFLYVADNQEPAIRKYDRTPRFFPSQVGNPEDRTQLSEPTTLVVDGSGNLFVVDRANNKIQKFAPRSR